MTGILPNTSAGSLRASDLALPLYQVVKRQISEAIMLGKWPAGTILPSEIALSQTFGVAVGTVRRALADLTNEGLLSRRRKTGTIVTGRTPQHSLRLFFQYFRLHGLDGSLQHSRAEVTYIAREAPTPDEQAKLKMDNGEKVVRFRRLRRINGIAVMHDHVVMAQRRLPNFPETKQDVPELLYLYLLEQYGIRISAVREQLGADLANDEDTVLLKLVKPAAVLTIDEIAYDQSGDAMILAGHRATTSSHRYINEVQ